MDKSQHITIPKNLSNLVRIVREYEPKTRSDLSSKIYFVGGTARDIFFGKDLNGMSSHSDLDLFFEHSLSQATISDLRGRFLTYHPNIDETSAPDSIFGKDYDPAKGLEKLLAGRMEYSFDLMALSFDGRIIDPHDGIRDINERRLRLVGSNLEQAVKANSGNNLAIALRGLRFCAEYGLDIEPATEKYLHQMIDANKQRLRGKIASHAGDYMMLDSFAKLYTKMLYKAETVDRLISLFKRFNIYDDFKKGLKIYNRFSELNGLERVKTLEELESSGEERATSDDTIDDPRYSTTRQGLLTEPAKTSAFKQSLYSMRIAAFSLLGI